LGSVIINGVGECSTIAKAASLGGSVSQADWLVPKVWPVVLSLTDDINCWISEHMWH